MKDLLQFPCELTAYKTYATKPNVQISFETQEGLDHDNLADLLSSKGKTGWLVFSPSEQRVQPEDIPTEPVKERETKSHSQRLYNVLFVYWNECTDKSQPFDRFREDQMEKLIEAYKSKLPPKE